MSMQKLRGIRNTGAYTAQRSMVEHLLLLEEIILREKLEEMEIPLTKIILAQHLQQYKEKNHLTNPFDIQDIQNYLLITIKQNLFWEQTERRGFYTSTLLEQAEGDNPITIDMQGEKIDYLLYAINTPRHITINNTKGDRTGIFAGSYQGVAHLTINNTKGEYTGSWAGSHQGQAHITINNTEGNFTGILAGDQRGKAKVDINNTKGHYTGESAGSNSGQAKVTINNTEGNKTGRLAGFDHGNAELIINNANGNGTGTFNGIGKGKGAVIAYNAQGQEQFADNNGILILKNPDRPPRIEGVDDKQKNDILKLIAQNASPEEIMNYLRRHT